MVTKSGLFGMKANAVLQDITDALELDAKEVHRRLTGEVVSTHMVESGNGKRKMLIVSELGIYDAIFSSRKKEAKRHPQSSKCK